MLRIKFWCAWLVLRGHMESVEWDTTIDRVTVKLDSSRWFEKKAMR